MKQFLLILALGFGLHTFAQKRLITHEDLIKMKLVRNPQLSPDGKWVLYELAEGQYSEKESVSDLWLVPSDGSQPARRFTSQKSAESNASWSPDGTKIIFTAKREADETAQIYMLDFKNGGEAQRITQITSGVKNPKFSPDGQKILFFTNGFAGCYADSCFKKLNEEKKNAKSKVRIYESFPIQNFDVWLDEKQNQVLTTDLAGKITNLTPNLSKVKEKHFKLNGAIWLNNNEIAYDISLDSNTTLGYMPNQFYVMNTQTLANKPLILSNQNVNIGGLQMNEAGTELYYTQSPNDREYYHIDKLWQVNYPSLKNAKEVAKELDRPINEFQILDNGTVLASVEEEGADKIMQLENGKARIVLPSKSDSYRNVQQRKGTTIALYGTASKPTELVAIDAQNKLVQLTHHNDELLDKLEIPEPETHWVTNEKGQKIRYMLFKPAKFDANKKYPLVHMMHGGPSSAFKYSFSSRWNAQFLAADKYVFLLTDYRGSTGYGEAFGNSIKLDAFRGPANDILLAGKDAITKNKYIDASRQAAGGASYGGHLANWMLGNAPHFKCLFNHAGLMNSLTQWGVSDGVYSREIMNGGMYWNDSKIWQDQNPINYAKNFKTPMLISVGELDFRVPMNHSIETYHILKRQQVPAKLLVFPDENHWILKAENHKIFMKEVQGWLTKYLD